MRLTSLVIACALLSSDASAQVTSSCRLLCAPDLKIEPTITFPNADFEVIVSVGVPTRIRWFEFTVETIFMPFDRDATPELEFESNFEWLSTERTAGWLSSHFDVVDKFSPAERATDTRTYTHKLNLELDTAVSIFHWLPQGRWLRGVELEGSLDYVATGLPANANPWSFSLVVVLPVAPF